MNSPFTTSQPLPEGFFEAPKKNFKILALGAELKSSFCLLKNGQLYLSEVKGDIEQETIYRNFTKQVDAILSHTSPTHLVIDKHPNYLSSQLGRNRAEIHKIKLTQVQHHHAHIAAVMADNHYPLHAKPVLGLALDGLGFGDDATLWGGEFLLSNYHSFERIGHFQPMPMLGGAAAIHEPWRNTLAHLFPVWEQVQKPFADTEIIQCLNQQPISILNTMANKGLNAPLTSSCGRLFDAVAAALGFHREQIEFEAQAAIHLEQQAACCFDQETKPYQYTIRSNKNSRLQLGWSPMWLEILKDLQNKHPMETIASRFHHTLIHALSEMAIKLRETYEFDYIALSGGVFQNQLISTHLPSALKMHGFNILQHKKIPTHDGGIAVGQVMIAAARSIDQI